MALVCTGWRNPAQELLWKDVRLKSDEEAKLFIEASKHVVASTRRLRVRDGTAPAGKRDSSPKRRKSLCSCLGSPTGADGFGSCSRCQIGSSGYRSVQGTRGGRPPGQDRNCRLDPVLKRLTQRSSRCALSLPVSPRVLTRSSADLAHLNIGSGTTLAPFTMVPTPSYIFPFSLSFLSLEFSRGFSDTTYVLPLFLSHPITSLALTFDPEERTDFSIFFETTLELLSTLGGRLRELKINGSEGEHWRTLINGLEPFLSLCTQLDTFNLTLDALPLLSHLPTPIQTLVISGSRYGTDDASLDDIAALDTILERRWAAVNGLEEIRFEEVTDLKERAAGREFVERCGRRGIKVVLEEAPVVGQQVEEVRGRQ